MVFDLIFAVVFALYYLRELEHVMEHTLVLRQVGNDYPVQFTGVY
jgi:hypothetical protein